MANRKLYFTGIITVILLFTMFYSCRKYFHYGNSTTEFTVEEAEDWYYTVFKKSREWKRSPTSNKQLPDWDHGSYVKI